MLGRELFSEQYVSQWQDAKKESISREIAALSMDRITVEPIETLMQLFEEKAKMDVPVLRIDELYSPEEPREVTSRERIRDQFFDDEYVNVNRSYIDFSIQVPFSGDSSLFYVKPTSSLVRLSGNTMNTTIERNEIVLRYHQLTDGSSIDLNSVYEKDLDFIQTNLKRLQQDADIFQKNIRSFLLSQLTKRKEGAEKSSSLLSTLKVPIKKRGDIPSTYSIPVVQKRVSIIQQKSDKPVAVEPTLDYDEYESILLIMKDMALAMERSPRTFSKLEEEEIRDFFLILLNGHYQGNATGETFNGSGKTDILVRYLNANAFVGECKFWAGPALMTKTIDQLLRYVTWRDTKTAIILFSKNKDLTAVIEKAQEAIKNHPSYKTVHSFKKGDLEKNETVFGFKMTHPADPQKEVYFSLLVFQVSEN